MALDRKQISDRIKVFRKNQKLTQKEFALRIGLKGHRIKDLEIYKSKPSVELISSIGEAFGVTTDRFLKESGVLRSTSEEETPLIEKQFPFMTGKEIEGWTEEDYIQDRVTRQMNNEIGREQRILEYLSQRPEIKEDLFQKAVTLEGLLLKDRITEKVKKLSTPQKMKIIEGLCTSEEEDVEEVIRRLDLELLYVVADRYRQIISET